MYIDIKKHLLVAFAVLVLGAIWAPSATLADDPNDILIVANKSVRVNSITENEAKNLFLRKRTQWPDGAKALPINASQKAEVRGVFDEKVLGMSLEDELVYWYKKKIQTGSSAPPEFSNPLKAVFRLKGSVSYVYRSQYREGVVKILLVVPAK